MFTREIWMFYTFALVIGIAIGGMDSLHPLVPAELFGLGSLGMIYGSVIFSNHIGGAIGPFLAGSIFDITGSYRLAFLICVLLMMLASILSLILLKAKG